MSAQLPSTRSIPRGSMKRALWLTTLSVLAVGCESAPTSPIIQVPAVELTLSESSVALTRTSTTQVTVGSSVSGSPGFPTDVTAAATWRTDNAEVATVAAGMILAVGPGTTNIIAEHGGQTKTIAVTVRRRTYVTGEVRVENLDGAETIYGVHFRLDGEWAGGRGSSGLLRVFTAHMGVFSPELSTIGPGNHTVTVTATGVPDTVRPTYKVTWYVPLRIKDLDTRETLATLQLSPTTAKATKNPAEISWQFAVPTYTS